MLLFAHTGIALGAVTAAAGIGNYRQKKFPWLESLSKYTDIRFLLIGSMLPDIIDKPVGLYLLRDYFYNGRIFSHTLLFLVLLTVIGMVLYKTHHQVWMLSLAAGTLIHLLLDGMWAVPGTLFWPALGFQFTTIEVEGWEQHIFSALFSNPSVYIPEIIGLIILCWFGTAVIRKKRVGALIKTGRIK